MIETDPSDKDWEETTLGVIGISDG